MVNKNFVRRAKGKHSQADKLVFDESNLRWATNELVADYRAEKLKCSIIADLCCGIGFQTISFAKKCKKVYAVEKDKEKLDLAVKNAETLGIKNIVFINGDVLDNGIIEKVKDSEIIFCDPERPFSEKERKIKSINPDINQLLNAYSKITDKIAIEFPPQIKEDLPDCEKEYISIDNKLNRLTLYFNSLKKSRTSAVILPKKDILRGDFNESIKSSKILDYLYEVDEAVQKAGLINELMKKTSALFYKQEKIAFLTSEKEIKSNFFVNSFKVLDICNFNDNNVINSLKKHNAKKVVLRFTIDPKQYWNKRTEYEKNLVGKDKLYLFKFDDKAVICKNLSITS